MKSLEKPCLVVHGNADTSVKPEAALSLCEWNPRAELMMISQADHVFGCSHPFEGDKLPVEMEQACTKTISFFHASLHKVFLVG